jgi:hypothetical protein
MGGCKTFCGNSRGREPIRNRKKNQCVLEASDGHALKALGLIVVTSALGYLLGYVLAWLWNRFGVAREMLVR